MELGKSVIGDMRRVRKAIEENELDALVLVSVENVQYVSGVQLRLYLIPTRLGMVVVPREGEPTLIVPSGLVGVSKRESWIEDIRGCVEFQDSPMGILVGVLKEKGLVEAKIGIEEQCMAASFYNELVELIPHATFSDCFGILEEVRSVKTPEEIKILESSIIEVEKAHLAAYTRLKPGDTERDHAKRLTAELAARGGHHRSFVMVATRQSAVMGHNIPTDTSFELGDLVWSDCGGWFSGYCAEVARMAVLGKASPKHVSTWQRIWEAEQKVLENLRVGVRARDIFGPVKKEFEDLSFYGHGTGLRVHDLPLLHENPDPRYFPYPEVLLEPNMIVEIEISLKDFDIPAFYHLEDLVLITEEGPRVLSNFMDRSKVLEIR